MKTRCSFNGKNLHRKSLHVSEAIKGQSMEIKASSLYFKEKPLQCNLIKNSPISEGRKGTEILKTNAKSLEMCMSITYKYNQIQTKSTKVSSCKPQIKEPDLHNTFLNGNLAVRAAVAQLVKKKKED